LDASQLDNGFSARLQRLVMGDCSAHLTKAACTARGSLRRPFAKGRLFELAVTFQII
jgi:hypothetical protein